VRFDSDFPRSASLCSASSLVLDQGHSLDGRKKTSRKKIDACHQSGFGVKYPGVH